MYARSGIKDKDYQLEPAIALWCNNDTNLRPISRVSLDKFLGYYSHLIRWPRAMRLAEFLHPFRFVQKASATDVSYLWPNLAMDDNDIALPSTRVCCLEQIFLRCQDCQRRDQSKQLRIHQDPSFRSMDGRDRTYNTTMNSIGEEDHSLHSNKSMVYTGIPH